MEGPCGNDDKRGMAHLDDSSQRQPCIVLCRSFIPGSIVGPVAGVCVVHFAWIFMWPLLPLRCVLSHWLPPLSQNACSGRIGDDVAKVQTRQYFLRSSVWFILCSCAVSCIVYCLFFSN